MTEPARIISAESDANLNEAAEILRAGGIVAFPTETVYGLGADALNAKAVARVFEVKKRPSFDPLIVHVQSPEEALRLWHQPPKIAEALIKKFWPGPLTLVCQKTSLVPDIVTAGLPTVAIRMPSNLLAQKLIKNLGSPIAAPSANLFGYTSATTAQAVAEDFGDSIDLILDGGAASIGIESTVIKIENNQCFLLRPGGICLEEIEKIVPVMVQKIASLQVISSPGQLESHYAPWTPLAVIEKDFRDFLKEVEDYHARCLEKEIAWPRLGLILFRPKSSTHLFESVEVLSASGDSREAASKIFHVLRKLDKMNLDFIVADRIEETGLGLAIMDRLGKAASGHQKIKCYFENLIR